MKKKQIRLSQFGTLLISRPAGREAYLAAQAYLSLQDADQLEIDFSNVKVAAPSWLDEFITPLKKQFGDKLHFSHTDNPSVKASLEMLQNTADE